MPALKKRLPEPVEKEEEGIEKQLSKLILQGSTFAAEKSMASLDTNVSAGGILRSNISVD